MTEAGASIGPWAWPGDEEFTQAEISIPKRKTSLLPPTALHPAAAESRGCACGGTASRVIAGLLYGLHHHDSPVPYCLLDYTPDRTGAAIYFGTSWSAGDDEHRRPPSLLLEGRSAPWPPSSTLPCQRAVAETWP